MSIQEALILAYLTVNLLAFLAFAWDKGAAVRKRPRIQERSLLLISMLGPFGAVAGMRMLHHKTRKRKFLLVPLFLLLHIGIIVALIFRPL